MNNDAFSRCDADHAFCRSCPERCFADEPLGDPGPAFFRWVAGSTLAGLTRLAKAVGAE